MFEAAKLIKNLFRKTKLTLPKPTTKDNKNKSKKKNITTENYGFPRAKDAEDIALRSNAKEKRKEAGFTALATDWPIGQDQPIHGFL